MANSDLETPLLGSLEKSISAIEREVQMKEAPLTRNITRANTKSDSKYGIHTICEKLAKMTPGEISIPFKGQSLQMTKNEEAIVFCGDEGRLGIYSLITSEVIDNTQLPGGNLCALALYKNDQYVVIGGDDSIIRKYRLSDFNLEGQLEGHKKGITAIRLSPDEEWLYSTSKDGAVIRWCMKDGIFKAIFKDSKEFCSMDLSQDGALLAAGCFDKVIVYDTKKGVVIKTLQVDNDQVWGISFSKSNSMIAAWFNNADCHIWDCKDWQLKRRFNGHEAGVACIKFLDNEQFIITASDDGTIRIWPVSYDRNEVVFTGHSKPIKSLIISADQKNFYSISEDSRILIWEVPESFNNEKRLAGHKDVIFNCLYSEKNDKIYTNANDKKIIIWSATEKELVKEIICEDIVYSMTLTLDEDVLVACTEGHKIVIWNLDTYERIYIHKFDDVVIESICSTPNKKYLITGDTAFRVNVYEYSSLLTNNELCVKFCIEKEATVWSLVVTHDSNTLIAGYGDGSIVMFDLNEETEICTLLGHSERVRCLAISRDSMMLISGSWDTTVKIWNIKNQFLYKTIAYHTEIINGIFISKLDEYFIVASSDKRISFWSLDDFSLITTLHFKDACTAINLSSEEKTLFVAENSDIYIQDNPMNTDNFWFYGPQKSCQHYVAYVAKIRKGEPFEHDPNMDDWILTPIRMNTVHLYAYYNLPHHLKAALSANSSIFNSKEKINPLTLAIEKDYIECVNTILASLQIKALESPESFYLVENVLTKLNEKGYTILNQLYDCLYTQSKDTSVPKFIDDSISLPIITYSTIKKINSQNFAPEKMFKNEGKPIQFWQSNIKIDMTLGSSESINFLRSIIVAPNDEILRSKFIQIVLNEKWKEISMAMKAQGFIYSIYLLLLAVYTIGFEGSATFLTPILLLNIFLMVYELLQMVLTGFEYWNDIWNNLDIARSMIFFCYFALIYAEERSDFVDEILVAVTLLSWVRGISYFRLFGETRYMINLLRQVFKDMISFLALFFYTIIAFCLISVAIYKGGNEEFNGFLTNSYRTALGDFDTDGYSSIEWVIFFLASMINTVIMLNLLIAIMGDSYDKVQEKREIAEGKELAELILEGETLLFWRRDSGQKKYLQICTEPEQIDQNETWVGKVRELKLKLSKVQKEIELSYERVEDRADEIMRFLKMD